MKIRQATIADFEQINEITAYGYGIDPALTKEKGLKRFEYTCDEQFLSEENGKITANARLIPLEQNIRGKQMKMGGVAMVTSDPVVRRRGHVREIMKYLLEKMFKEKYEISCLYPFKDTFYAKFGYANISASTCMLISPKFLKKWNVLPEGYTIQRLHYEDGFKIYKEIHELAVKQIHGGVIRSEKRWKEYDNPNLSSYIIVYNQNGIPEGFMRVYPKGFMQGFEWAEEGKLLLNDFFALTPKAKHALFNFLYMHSDQVTQIKIPIYPCESEWYPWLQEYYVTSLKSMNIWQARIINVQKALTNLPTEQDGSLKIKVNDGQILENNQTYEVEGHKGALRISELGNKQADLGISIEGLTSIFYGILSLSELELFGWAKKQTNEQTKILDQLFPMKVPYITEEF